MQVTVEIKENKLYVASPYNKSFVSRARDLDGSWQKPYWVFSTLEEESVRKALMEVYGEDGRETIRVDVEIFFREDYAVLHGPIVVCGRQLARAFGRDSGAQKEPGIVVKSGGFDSSGSVKNWRTYAKEGTRVVLRDVPQAMVDQHDIENITVTIITSRSEQRDALIAERKRLLARLDEIEKILNGK